MIQKGSLSKTLILGALCGALLITAVALLADPAQLYSSPTSHPWFLTVHTTVNSYHTWRIDRLTSILSSAIVKSVSDEREIFRVIPTVQILIFYFGVLLLLFSKGRSFISDSITHWLVPTLLCISMILSFGLDVVIFGSIQWIPWLTIALGGLQTTASMRDVVARLPICIAICFFTLLLGHAANQCAVIALIPALIFHRLIFQQGTPAQEADVQIEEHTISIPSLIVKSLLVCAAVYISFSAPVAHFPSYPPDALIVPDDGVAGIVRPDVGNDYSLAVINREATREILFPFTSALLLCVVAAWGYVRFSYREAPRMVLTFSFFLGVILLLDSLLPEKAALQLPLGALQRVLPGLSYMPVHLLVLAIMTYFSFVGLTSIRKIIAPCILFVALLTIKAASYGISIKSLFAPPYSSDASGLVREAFYNLKGSDRERFISPSLFVMQYFNYLFLPIGEERGVDARAVTSLIPVPLTMAGMKVETTPPTSNNQVEKMFDRDASTRWSPGGGRQLGGESVTLHFSTPLTFDGIKIETGNFITDYPRGVTIVVPAKCGERLTTDGEWNFPEWKGSLRFSNDNVPYFGPQSDVVIPFGTSVVTSCLAITQTGSDVHYDWSVAEISRLVRSQN